MNTKMFFFLKRNEKIKKKNQDPKKRIPKKSVLIFFFYFFIWFQKKTSLCQKIHFSVMYQEQQERNEFVLVRLPNGGFVLTRPRIQMALPKDAPRFVVWLDVGDELWNELQRDELNVWDKHSRSIIEKVEREWGVLVCSAHLTYNDRRQVVMFIQFFGMSDEQEAKVVDELKISPVEEIKVAHVERADGPLVIGRYLIRNSRIKVVGFGEKTTEYELGKVFARFGCVLRVDIVGRNAYIVFQSSMCAYDAIRDLDGKMIVGFDPHPHERSRFDKLRNDLEGPQQRPVSKRTTSSTSRRGFPSNQQTTRASEAGSSRRRTTTYMRPSTNRRVFSSSQQTTCASEAGSSQQRTTTTSMREREVESPLEQRPSNQRPQGRLQQPARPVDPRLASKPPQQQQQMPQQPPQPFAMPPPMQPFAMLPQQSVLQPTGKREREAELPPKQRPLKQRPRPADPRLAAQQPQPPMQPQMQMFATAMPPQPFAMPPQQFVMPPPQMQQYGMSSMWVQPPNGWPMMHPFYWNSFPMQPQQQQQPPQQQ